MRKSWIVIASVFVALGFTYRYSSNTSVVAQTGAVSVEQFKKELKQLLDKRNFSGFSHRYKSAITQYPSNKDLLNLNKEFIAKDYIYSVLMDTVAKGVSLYSKQPGSNCDGGSLSAYAQNRFVSRLNYYRRLAGVYDSCVLSQALNAKAQQTAHFMHINNTLTHQPNASMKCYKAVVAETAGKSNLSLGYGFQEALNGQMAENEGSNAAAGHRRWILNPKNHVFGFGSTDRAMCLYVIDTGEPSYDDYMSVDTNYVAWPAAGYFPKDLIFRRWSFSLDKADFTNAQVSVSLNGKSLRLSKEKPAIGYALNTLVWNMDEAIQANQAYTVKISKVKAINPKGETVLKSFTYTVVPLSISL